MMNPKTNTVRESQQANDINLKLQTKNEITFSGSLSKDYRIYYLQEYEGSKDVELWKRINKKNNDSH